MQHIYITVRGYFYFPHPDNHNLMHRCTHTADNLRTDQHVFYKHQVVAILHEFIQ